MRAPPITDDKARAPSFGEFSALYFTEKQVAAKTGTTNDYRDAWVIGYTPNIAIGAWAGNNDNSPMIKKVAAFIVAPMWHEVMERAIEKYPSEGFTPAAPETEYDSLPAVLRGKWNENLSEGAHDILYWVDKNNPRGGRPENPQRDSQFPYWEYPVQAWFSGSPLSAGAPLQLPGGSFIITAPQDGAVVSGENAIAISVFHPNPASVNRISYYLNDAPIGESAAAPFSLSFSSPVRGSATLRAVAESSSGSETRVISFTIQ